MVRPDYECKCEMRDALIERIARTISVGLCDVRDGWYGTDTTAEAVAGIIDAWEALRLPGGVRMSRARALRDALRDAAESRSPVMQFRTFEVDGRSFSVVRATAGQSHIVFENVAGGSVKRAAVHGTSVYMDRGLPEGFAGAARRAVESGGWE